MNIKQNIKHYEHTNHQYNRALNERAKLRQINLYCRRL